MNTRFGFDLDSDLDRPLEMRDEEESPRQTDLAQAGTYADTSSLSLPPDINPGGAPGQIEAFTFSDFSSTQEPTAPPSHSASYSSALQRPRLFVGTIEDMKRYYQQHHQAQTPSTDSHSHSSGSSDQPTLFGRATPARTRENIKGMKGYAYISESSATPKSSKPAMAKLPDYLKSKAARLSEQKKADTAKAKEVETSEAERRTSKRSKIKP